MIQDFIKYVINMTCSNVLLLSWHVREREVLSYIIWHSLHVTIIVASLVNKAPTSAFHDIFVSLRAHLLEVEATVKRNSHPTAAIVSAQYQYLNLLHVQECIFL